MHIGPESGFMGPAFQPVQIQLYRLVSAYLWTGLCQFFLPFKGGKKINFQQDVQNICAPADSIGQRRGFDQNIGNQAGQLRVLAEQGEGLRAGGQGRDQICKSGKSSIRIASFCKMGNQFWQQAEQIVARPLSSGGRNSAAAPAINNIAHIMGTGKAQRCQPF